MTFETQPYSGYYALYLMAACAVLGLLAWLLPIKFPKLRDKHALMFMSTWLPAILLLGMLATPTFLTGTLVPGSQLAHDIGLPGPTRYWTAPSTTTGAVTAKIEQTYGGQVLSTHRETVSLMRADRAVYTVDFPDGIQECYVSWQNEPATAEGYTGILLCNGLEPERIND